MIISLIGKTFDRRASIKARGFAWNKDFSRWDKDFDNTLAQKIIGGDIEAIKETGLNIRGCAILICTPNRPVVAWESASCPEINLRKHVSAGYMLDHDNL